MTITTTRPHKGEVSGATYSYEGGLKKAIDIAEFYGFHLIPPLKVEKEDKELSLKHRCPEHHLAVIRKCAQEEPHKTNGAAFFVHTKKVPYKQKLELRLDIVGDKESSAESLLLQAACSILKEYGYDDLTASVNSVGGKESTSLFIQAITSYYRSRLGELETTCREAFKESVFSPLRCTHESCRQLRHDAPQSLNFLSELSKQHFKEVLEYLEVSDISYVINPSLVGSEHYTTRTLFQIGTPGTQESTDDTVHDRVLAWGERYDLLSKKAGCRKSIPMIHMTLDLNIEDPDEQFVAKKKAERIPEIYMIHVGFPAKLQTLRIIENLRKARIKIQSQIHAITVSEQMERARLMGIPVVIIIGQKEVFEGTALVRHMHTNRQDTIPQEKLALYLKEVMA